ncbi:dephospho-CoA kinase [Synechocystis sp. LKSZ1]|uniref:dephospho-CoA kinase n=1 Tax=Synechocystis sp. LKSZ1 TaxID=3144951 RepID=UPI00336BC3D7
MALGQGDSPKRLIGLTGGIATGKSTVADYLQQRYQLTLLDADHYAREAVSPLSPILQALAQRYGLVILLADGNLDRPKLGEIIFNDPQERAWVESQIHPYVRACFEQALHQLSDPTLVLVIPLLFEAGLTDWVTEIWVVTCRPEQQLQRLIQRNSLSEDQAQQRILSQLPLAKKVERADVVLDNSGDLAHLYGQIDQALGRR